MCTDIFSPPDSCPSSFVIKFIPLPWWMWVKHAYSLMAHLSGSLLLNNFVLLVLLCNFKLSKKLASFVNCIPATGKTDPVRPSQCIMLKWTPIFHAVGLYQTIMGRSRQLRKRWHRQQHVSLFRSTVRHGPRVARRFLADAAEKRLP
jgi:hypothetical protein